MWNLLVPVRQAEVALVVCDESEPLSRGASLYCIEVRLYNDGVSNRVLAVTVARRLSL